MSAVRRSLPSMMSIFVLIGFSGFAITETGCGSSGHSTSMTNGGTGASGTTGSGTGTGSGSGGTSGGGTSGGG